MVGTQERTYRVPNTTEGKPVSQSLAEKAAVEYFRWDTGDLGRVTATVRATNGYLVAVVTYNPSASK